MDELNDRLEFVEEVLELCTGIPTTFLAIYSTYKLRCLVTFPATTRIVMGASTSAIALMCLLHPLLNMIPEEVYSLERGHYVAATVVYSLQFVCLACTLLLDTKFLLMGYESHLAFKHRTEYENRDGGQGWLLVGYYLGFAIIVSWVKVVWYVFFTEMPLDQRLHFAFFIEDSMPFVSFQYFIGLIAIVFGMTKIWRIHRFATQMKYQSETLSESFQVKQIVTLLGILKPLAVSFIVGYVFALFFHVCGVVMLFKGHSRMYRTLTAAVFALGGFYNTFALMFLLWYLPALRQLMIRDVSFVCCFHTHRIAHSSDMRRTVVDRIEQPDDHFGYLRDIWNR